jgi:hypothetical protein
MQAGDRLILVPVGEYRVCFVSETDKSQQILVIIGLGPTDD